MRGRRAAIAGGIVALALALGWAAGAPVALLREGVFGWGFLTALPVAGLPPLGGGDPSAWSALAWVVLACTVGTYALNLYALKTLPSSTVAVLIYLQPFVATSLAFPLLGETPTLRMIVAAAITFAGVGLATRPAPAPAAPT